MYLPLPLHCWHVWYYVHRCIQRLFKRQIYSVQAVQRYKLSHATTKSTLLFVSNDPSSHVYAISRSTYPRTDQYLTSCTNITWSLFSSAANTIDSGAVYFRSTASAPNFWLLVEWGGTQLELFCHISFFRMDNQFANEIFKEIFMPHFAATWLVYKNCVQNIHVCKVEKQFLGPLPCSESKSVAVDHSVWLVHKPHVCILVFYNTRFKSLARFVGEISFNRGSVHVCQNVHIPLVFPANGT